MKKLLKYMLAFIDVILVPFVYPAAFLLKIIRMAGVHRMPACKGAMLQIGVFPIRDHYTEPLFDARLLSRSLEQARTLPGIDWNSTEQLKLLECFNFNGELAGISEIRTAEPIFHFNNIGFESGDAEFL